MTREHAAIQLLRHGDLSRREFAEITGWPARSADNVLYRLCKRKQIRRCKFGVYSINQGA